MRSVIQPKIDRSELHTHVSSRVNDYKSKDSIRIPSMSWYIKNSILPKKGKEIQETIEKYLRAGGSLNSKSLPKRLMARKKSIKAPDSKVLSNDSMKDYPVSSYQQYLESAGSEVQRTLLPVNRVMINPELKNLNLKAVEKIILQRLLDQKSMRCDQTYLRHRQAKHRSRLKTAG